MAFRCYIIQCRLIHSLTWGEADLRLCKVRAAVRHLFVVKTITATCRLALFASLFVASNLLESPNIRLCNCRHRVARSSEGPLCDIASTLRRVDFVTKLVQLLPGRTCISQRLEKWGCQASLTSAKLRISLINLTVLKLETTSLLHLWNYVVIE